MKGKLNDALNRPFFPRFHSSRCYTPSFSYLQRPPESITYCLLLPDSQFISLPFSLSFYLSILFICLPIYFPSCFVIPSLFWQTILSQFLLSTTFSNFDNAFWRFIKIFIPVSWTANGIRVRRTSVKEVNLKLVVTWPPYFLLLNHVAASSPPICSRS